MNLILPVAGKSSRFPNLKPKWLLTHPNGNLMITEAIRGLNLKDFEKIYLISLDIHFENFNLKEVLFKQFRSLNIDKKLEFVCLKRQTNSQPQTIYEGIKHIGLDGGIYIKDSDNFFKELVKKGNFISIGDLNELELANVKNKSYVSINENNILTNIVEKRIISPFFNVGGYGFESAKDFVKYYKILSNEKELYISHIIYKMICDGHTFIGSKVKNYLDWGTLEDWNKYKSHFITLFVDIDGVLVYNSSQFFSPKWGETAKIKENVEILNKLYESQKVQIILTTSRTIEVKDLTEKQLKKENIKYHQIIFNLYHTKRIVINDYAYSNPYKSCDCINLQRDSKELKFMLGL